MSLHTTVACVIQRDNRYLMVEEARGGPVTLFNQPAGHVEPGEGPIAAVLREVAEETAWRIRLTGYLGLYVFQTPTGLTFHSHGFVAEPVEFLATPLDTDITATHWLSEPDLHALNQQHRLRSPLVLERIIANRENRLYPLSVIHESATDR